MKPATPVLLLASSAIVFGQDCTNDCTGTAAIYIPAPIVPDTNTTAAIEPSTNFTLPYASNTSASTIEVTNSMRYPTVLLESIGSLINVDCSATSVRLTFNDSTIFTETELLWAAQSQFVMVTNHFGDCDEELERGFFLVDGVTFNTSILVVTANAAKSNISETAETTEIFFGQTSTSTPTTKSTRHRDLLIDPTYTLNTEIALPPETVLYSYDPYLTVTADKAEFDANVTFSGYLAYDWLTAKLKSLYFDIDAGMSASLGLSVDVTASYNTTFSYAPAVLFYGLTIPGLLELGPQLQFAVEADVNTTAAVGVQTEFGIDITGGNVHLDFLNRTLSSTSGWTPTYTAMANISGNATASITPVAALTIELAVNFFGGLLDLSTGVTARPGFDFDLGLKGAASADLTDLKTSVPAADCGNGLDLYTAFIFSIDLFATQFWETNLYNVTIPFVDQCYSWA